MWDSLHLRQNINSEVNERKMRNNSISCGSEISWNQRMSWNYFVFLKNCLSSLYSIISIVYYEICSAGNIFMSECCIFSQSIGPLPGHRVSFLSNWKRHLQPKEEYLHLYLARQKWQCLPSCSASSMSVSRGQQALSPITQCTQQFSSKLPYSLSGTVCGCSLFFCCCNQHILFEWFWGFAFFVCARMCVNVCWPFMLQDPRRGTVSVLWFCKTPDTLGTQWSSLTPLVQQAIILNW